jgi:hypothetical protein
MYSPAGGRMFVPLEKLKALYTGATLPKDGFVFRSNVIRWIKLFREPSLSGRVAIQDLA